MKSDRTKKVAAPVERASPYNIVTHYYNREEVLIKKTRALHANSASLNCLKHMQLDHYDASLAEIFDDSTGVPHATFYMNVVGRIEIIYKREVKEGM